MPTYKITYERADMIGECIAYKTAHTEDDALKYLFGKKPKNGLATNDRKVQCKVLNIEQTKETL